jgi:hypothetical protein
VIGSRRAYRRPYFFEIFSAAQIVVVYLIIAMRGPAIGKLVNDDMIVTVIAVTILTLAGLAVRGAVEAARGRGRRFLRSIANAGWMTDTVRLIIGNAFLIGVYGAIKLVVPIYNGRLYDEQLWKIDSAMFGGYSPVIFVLSAFSNPHVLQFFDASYARIFLVSLNIAYVYFMSHPSRRLRIAFADGNMALWCVGAWLYLLVPSLGPAYVFPDLWLVYRQWQPVTNQLHATLIANYEGMLRIKRGAGATVFLLYGVAAFPSLHVAFQTFMFVWMRRLWISAQVLFGFFTVLILLGSMITGWHYLIDGIAGIVMAVACYAVAARGWRIDEWTRLRDAIRR